MNIRDRIVDFFRWLLRPNPHRFLVVWYTAWLGFSLKGFFVNWLICHQPIRVAWVPVTGPVETLYLLAEIGVVGTIAWQAWRFERANWRLAFIYEWYNLLEISLSLLNSRLWTYAMNQMWCKPVTFFGMTVSQHLPPSCQASAWNDAAAVLLSHASFVAFYAFIHHGLPLLILAQAARQATQRYHLALSPQLNPS